MKILKIREQKDGSALLDLEMTNEEQRLLVQYAVRDIIHKALKKYNKCSHSLKAE